MAANHKKVYTEEERDHLSRAAKLRWQSKEYRDKQFSEAHRLKLSKSGKRAWKSKKYREKMSRIRKSIWQSNEYKEKMSKSNSRGAKLRWESNEYREKQSLSQRESWKVRRIRDKRIKGVKLAWKTCGQREKQSLSMRGIPKTKEHKEKISKMTTLRIINGYKPKVHSKKGYFFSKKNGNDIYYESSYELAAFKILESDKNVTRYDRCRWSIDYYNGGHKRSYIPDIEVYHRNGIREIIEIKPIKIYLTDTKSQNKAHYAGPYCARNGMVYSIWTEHMMRMRLGDEFTRLKLA